MSETQQGTATATAGTPPDALGSIAGALGGAPAETPSADRQVEALVNAMAIFSPPTAADTALPENYHESLSAMLAASLR
ncbi:MAG TPA: hypothetical protein VF613_17970 [Longimicrobium sp.]